MSTSEILQRLYSLDTSSPDFLRHLHCLIQTDEEEQYLNGLRGPELSRLVDFLDGALGVTQITDDTSRRCLHKLQVICRDHSILPSSYTVPGDLARVGDDPVASGGFADIWEGTHNGNKVCIKLLRINTKNRPLVEKAFFKEAIMWKSLGHPNIVPFIGVTRTPMQFVLEWMPNGMLTEYVNANPDANRVGLLLDVADGLTYLHLKHTIHGDLKGANILVDRSGHARLTGFGFASVVRELNSVLVTQVQGYSKRWAAPEVLQKGDRYTREADIFAFGMVVTEVFTGCAPFSEFTGYIVISKIVDGERPGRPRHPGLTDSVWDITLCCWHQDPVHRPTMTKVVKILRECYRHCPAYAPLSRLVPPPPMESMDNPGNLKPSSLIPTDGFTNNSLPSWPPTDAGKIWSKPPGTSQHSGRLSSQKKGISVNLMPLFSISSPRFFRSSPSSSSQSLPKCPSSYSDSGNSHGDHLPPIVRSMRLTNDSHHPTIPTSCRLEGVILQGDHAQHTSQATELWKGMYNNEVVALNFFRVPQDDPQVPAVNSWFSQEIALMKQVEHENILPFYGVATTISYFCLVFPWYENGSIMDYLNQNLYINRYGLISGAVDGLCFLHDSGFVHAGLRPGHILIDGNGNPRLAIAGRSSIVAALDASVTGRVQPTLGGEADDSRYSAPEIQRPEDYGLDNIILTRESDVYEMAMVIYEVLTENKPFYNCEDRTILPKVLAGEIPQRPSGRIDDLLWGLLAKCWSRVGARRPQATEVQRTLLSPSRQLARKERPGKLKSWAQSILSTGSIEAQGRATPVGKRGDRYR